jgi:hypothetical protein
MSLPLRLSDRSAAAITIPEKSGVDATFVVYEARSYLIQTSIPITLRHRRSFNPHSPGTVPAV